MATHPSLRYLLALIDQAYDRRAWHGPNLRASLRGVNAATAVWRPAEGRHTIWELTVHAAYWKHTVWQRITGERDAFERAGANFFAPAEPADEKAWRADLALLQRSHVTLRAAIAALSPRDLARPNRNRFDTANTIIGIAAHDIYHAGQIQLIRRLAS